MIEKVKFTNTITMTYAELAAPDKDIPGNPPHVMTLLRNKILNPENIPKILFELKDTFGTSVLDVCIERFKEPVQNRKKINVPRALHLAVRTFSFFDKNKCCIPIRFRTIKEILMIASANGWSVAHQLAKDGLLPEIVMTEEILKLEDNNGCSVAYLMAENNTLPNWARKQKNILTLRSEKGNSVAYALATEDLLPEKMMMNHDILKIRNRNGRYVAHGLAGTPLHKEPYLYNLPFYEKIMSEEILKLEDCDGYSVAYLLVYSGNKLPEWAKRKKDILMLKNSEGELVVHLLAEDGDLPIEMMTPDILQLQNKRGSYTVLDILVKHRHLTPEILALPWDGTTFVFEHVQTTKFQKNMSAETLAYVKTQFKQMQLRQSKQRLVTQTSLEISEMER